MIGFGPFAIDTRTWTLCRAGVRVDLSPRLVEILAHIVSRGGEIVTKDELLDRFWPDTHVTDNTLTRAVADIRKALGESPTSPAVIQTMARRGYRFAGNAEPVDRASDPLAQWVSGRLALESLDESRLAEATRAFEAAAAAMPDYAPGHAGVANAWVLRFETTRSTNAPDRRALSRAIDAATRACALDTHLGEAWAVLAHAQALAGHAAEAQSSARRAVACELGNWRHHYRLAVAGWGEERLRAADRTLRLFPACAAAHLLSAMVFLARGALDPAAQHAESGAVLQDQQAASAVLPAAGLHWMRGLVHVAAAQLADALQAFAREVAAPSVALYSREFALNARLAVGFVHLHEGRRTDALREFREAEAAHAGNARVVCGLALVGAADARALDRAVEELNLGGKPLEAVFLIAVRRASDGQVERAAVALADEVAKAPPGPLGWSLGADPMFLPFHGSAAFERALATVASRAG